MPPVQQSDAPNPGLDPSTSRAPGEAGPVKADGIADEMQPGEKTGARSFYRLVFPPMLLLALLLVIYGNSFQAPFVFDDFINIVDNPNLRLKNLSTDELAKSLYGRSRSRSRINRPVAYLTLAVNHYLGGENTTGYHLVNFSVHGLAAMALFFLTFRILRLPAVNRSWGRETAVGISLLSAALWASHPIQVSAVTYIVQRMASLAGLFSLLSIYSFIAARSTEREPGRRALCFGFCAVFGALAIGSKENAVMLPVLLVVVEFLLLRRPGKRDGKRIALFLAGGVVFVALVGMFLANLSGVLENYQERPFTLWERMLTQPRVFLLYVSQLFYPTSDRFMLLHDIELSRSLLDPWSTLPALLVWIGVPVAGVALGRRQPLVSFSLLFFWLNHLIEGSVLPLELVFEHRNYLPSMFVFLPPAAGLLWLVKKYSLRYLPVLSVVFLATVFLFSQGHSTHLRNEAFSNPVLLWLDNVQKAPSLHRTHHNLGKAFLIYGFEEKGTQEFQTALESRAIARHNQKYDTHHGLGVYNLLRNQPEKAAVHFQEALRLLPRSGKALHGLSRAMLTMGDLERAERYAAGALGSASQRPKALLTLGWIRLRQKKPEEARKIAVAAVLASPSDRAPFSLAGESFRMEGDLERALHYYRLYSQAYPDDRGALAALIEVQDRLGQTAAAEKTVWKLLKSAGGALPDVLAAYDRNYNQLGAARMDRIRSVIHETVDRSLRAGNAPGAAD